MLFRQFLLLMILPYITGFTYSLYGGNRYPPATPRRHTPYIPMVNTRREYQVPDYEEGYVPGEQLDFDYYDKYDPYMKYGGGPLLPFYLPSEYYANKIPKKNLERLGYYDDQAQASPDAVDDDVDGMYLEDAWYDDPSTSENSRAFIRNLVMSQMYQDSVNPPAYRYDLGNEDRRENNYEYGIPTTSLEETEKARKYFEEKSNEEVKELEALVRKQGKDEEIFDEKKRSEEPTKPEGVAVAEGFRLEKKQVYDSTGQMSKYYDLDTLPDETTTNSIKKLNTIKGKETVKETFTSTTWVAPLTTASPPNPAKVGQKEVVLPRPSNPARKPYPEIATRSMNPPSVYDTIKKLLDMEKEAENKNKAQPQKRFVVTDDPLTAELANLKKSSA